MPFRFLAAVLPGVMALLSVALPTVPAHAASEYPAHAIRMVVPYPAGGSTDVVARAIAQHMGAHLKQTFIVDNKPGASGMIGTEWVAKSAPDGYTLEFTASDTHSINPSVYRDIRYDAKRDFTPIGLVGYLPLALVARANLPVQNTADLIALARQKPGQLTYASYGVGSSSQVAMEMLNTSTGINLLHVPFQGAAPAMTAILAGQVDAMMVPLTMADPNYRAGKVKILGVALQKPFPGMEDLPTFESQNLPISARAWLGIFGPAKLPKPIVDKLNQALNEVLTDPAVLETLVKNGLQPEAMSPSGFRDLVDSDFELWGGVVRKANIRHE
ncbi:tripartite tricarboxylate transporter substrate binding protein [Bordetella sp. BOR01]|uniref:Bug family tripartite tricarboxylate transporter substrate binding protein n=1 Tax=Bordetella sp. BOR01 TaxID=2854779 RepID=UPI001C475DE1|nr:tripartite tricarboxylate transporter substrate binding protein [Bordetella sp. BOR01]MBV7482945.1 tripartite tricarboxylate transporter substrate binding protein [Bordetella sp. BOR01]